MPADLHLFSLPGRGDISNILEACRPYMAGRPNPAVAFIQWASVRHDWLGYTQKAFAGLAEVLPLLPDPGRLDENRRSLERAAAVYISGGNTYLLIDRMLESGLFPHLRRLALDGLPLVGFSAGAIVCGPNILTTHDINMVPTTRFDGLDLLPHNVAAHYPAAGPERDAEDDWLSDYQARHANPILALEDDAYARWDGAALTRVSGSAWLLEPGAPRAPLG